MKLTWKVVKTVKIIEPSAEILNISTDEPLKFIESVARTCYQSHDLTKDGSDERIVRMLISNGHEAMLEHVSVSVRFICDRGVSHELVRHRIASFAQESTRYCNYKNKDICFIKPLFFEENSKLYNLWKDNMLCAEKAYNTAIHLGALPQEARSFLPNSLKTDIVVTANLREWRNIFKLRCDITAHPQMRQVMNMALSSFRERIPIVFDDIGVD